MSDPASSTPSVPSAPSVPSVQTHRPLPVPGAADGAERLRPLAPPSPSDTDVEALAPRAALGSSPSRPGPARAPASGPTSGPVDDTGGSSGTSGSRGTSGTGGGVSSGAGNDGQWTCPHCSAVLEKEALFCEVCGYDPSTGSLPHVQAPEPQPTTAPSRPTLTAAPATAGPAASSAPPASSTPAAPLPPGSRLVLVINADKGHYGRHGVDEILFPVAVPPRTIELGADPVSIGRRSRSRGTNPTIDLVGPPEDPAVSHTHASLVPNDDGGWSLVDHGSTNGTFLNDNPDAVPANRPIPLSAGDRVYVGAWTCITLEIRTS